MPICLLMNVLRRPKSRNSPMIQWNCAIIHYPAQAVKEKFHESFSTSFPQFYFEFSTFPQSFPHFIHILWKIFIFKFHFQFQIFPQGTIEIFIFKFHPRNVRNFHFQTVWNFIFNFNFRLRRASVIIAYPARIVNLYSFSWKVAYKDYC